MQIVTFVFFSIILTGVTLFAQTQATAPSQGDTTKLRIIVGAHVANSGSVVAIPAFTNWQAQITMGGQKQQRTVLDKELLGWLEKESTVNGLESDTLQPWHIVIAYDQFDEDGDNVHSGEFDEVWAGAKRYKASYKSDDLKQTDSATEQGLLRSGDQHWPSVAETIVRDAVIAPMYDARKLRGYKPNEMSQYYDGHLFDCVKFISDSNNTVPAGQYCFDHNGPALRYVRGDSWHQTTYNNIELFQGRYIARDVVVTDGGKPYLKLHVKTLEPVSGADASLFQPTADAVNLHGKTQTGVPLIQIDRIFPQWPDSLRTQHFSVTLKILIGTDGKVKNAQAISGLKAAYKSAESTVRKWTFEPFLVLGQPEEVESQIELRNN